MGVMYKLLRHRQASRTMDLTHTRQVPQRQRTITLEGRIVEKPYEQLQESEVELDDDGKFTAEHILQLCKFLAEKSRRNKAAVCNASVDAGFLNESFHHAENDAFELTSAAKVAHLLPQSRLNNSESQVLTDASNANSNIDINKLRSPIVKAANPTECDDRHHVKGKRDVLLKIRQQIFERKRQRQLAHVQQRLGVWRPW